MHDSWEIESKYLEEADFYFKRSYRRFVLKDLGNNRCKVFPLGLYYEIYPDHVDRFALQRIFKPSLNWKARAVQFFRSIDVWNITNYYPRMRFMEALPDASAPPKILFMVRVWDPADDPTRPKEKVEERQAINQMRADCIRALHHEFGNLFYGGLVHTIYAEKHFKDCLLPNKSTSAKRNYIRLLKSYPICVATTGLHGSIGGKFSEYVAFSKAIVSEKLEYEAAGDLREGMNYLEFSSPESCVTQVAKLFTDGELRKNIMLNNARYYQSYLRPDVLVLNSILVALQDNGVGDFPKLAG